MADSSRRQAKKKQFLDRILHKEQEKAKIKQIRKVLKKKSWERLPEEVHLLQQYSDVVEDMQSRINKRLCTMERLKEVEDGAETLAEKCWQLAQAIKEARSIVIYTGAGISTAAEIPDYRGPEGIWTLLQKGKSINVQDLSSADPTFTHMAIVTLYREGLLHHVVSQNCDGLHLKSGLPCKVLSEVHGNMYIEVCPKCKPLRQYIRLFDVTEHTGLHRHKTGRKCHRCAEPLHDTIVHFGERGKLRWPLNWEGAVKAVNKCDMILCLGTSLKVLRRYPCLWKKDRPPKLRPKLYIVNLQWTPKDEQAVLKINGKCDEVLRLVMSHLGLTVPCYDRSDDPMFHLATPLRPGEESTTTRKQLIYESSHIKKNFIQNEKISKTDSTIRTRRLLYRDHSYAKANRDYLNIKNGPKSEERSETFYETGLLYNCHLPNSSSFFGCTQLSETETPFSEISCDSFNEQKCLESNNLLSSKRLEKSSPVIGVQEKKEITDANDIGLTGWYGKGRRKCRRSRRKRL